MFNGFDRIIEERIRKAQRAGEFDNLPGAGEPLSIEEDRHIPEDLRLAYKVLKNADCIPPEIELKKEISRAEDMLEHIEDTAEKYRILKKINFMIMKLNTLRETAIHYEMPEKYLGPLAERLQSNRPGRKAK